MLRRDRVSAAGPVRALGLAGLLVLCGVGATARADLLDQTGFEAPTFTANQTVDGQGGFTVPLGNAAAVTVSTDSPNSGSQDLLFTGTNLTDVYPPDGYFQATAAVTTNYDVVANGNSRLVLDAYLMLHGDSTATGIGHTGDLVSINLEANLADGSYFSTYLSSDGNAYGFSNDYDAMTFVGLTGYHHVTLVLDFSTDTASYLVDGMLFGTKSFDPSTSTTLASASLTMYDFALPDAPADYTARVDDFSVRAVPEPSSVVLCLIGALGVSRRLARRRS